MSRPTTMAPESASLDCESALAAAQVQHAAGLPTARAANQRAESRASSARTTDLNRSWSRSKLRPTSASWRSSRSIRLVGWCVEKVVTGTLRVPPSPARLFSPCEGGGLGVGFGTIRRPGVHVLHFRVQGRTRHPLTPLRRGGGKRNTHAHTRSSATRTRAAILSPRHPRTQLFNSPLVGWVSDAQPTT